MPPSGKRLRSSCRRAGASTAVEYAVRMRCRSHPGGAGGVGGNLRGEGMRNIDQAVEFSGIQIVGQFLGTADSPMRTLPATGAGSRVRPASEVVTSWPAATSSAARSAASAVPPRMRIFSATAAARPETLLA